GVAGPRRRGPCGPGRRGSHHGASAGGRSEPDGTRASRTSQHGTARHVMRLLGNGSGIHDRICVTVRRHDVLSGAWLIAPVAGTGIWLRAVRDWLLRPSSARARVWNGPLAGLNTSTSIRSGPIGPDWPARQAYT